MVLVVRHAGQSGVKGHHDQGELQEGPEQAGTSPRETGLKVQLEAEIKRTDTKPCALHQHYSTGSTRSPEPWL